VGKQSRTNRKSARAGAAPVKPPERRRLDRRLLGVAGGAGLLLVVGLAIAALTVAAMAGGGAKKIPSGTDVFTEDDHTHVSTPVRYDHNPPAGGAHNPTPVNCGVYSEQVPNENAVHSLEHGAVWITYQPTLSASDVSSLRRLVTSNYVGTQRYVILSPYQGLPAPVVASAWGAQLKVQTASDSRLAEFIHYYAGGGQGGEPGGECTGGVGTPDE
jgi:hypothetical protein